MEMTWLNGRKLTTLQSGNDSISYKYDSNGVRTSKTVNGVEYTYEYLNGKLMHETRGEKVFDYCYDANGQLYAVSYKANSSTDAVTYYFAHNWRGDITSIYDGDGNVVAKYEYDDWGNVLTVTDANNKSITDKNHIANLNPFRYRSYYYDSESGLYYLMSRYYDPVTHRFLNADGYFQSGNGILDTNMNAYCRNNPINCADYSGNSVFSFSLFVSASFFLGGYCSLNFVFDSNGGTAIQCTYIDYSENTYLGAISASAGASLNFIWDADTVEDLEKNQTLNVGGSLGEGFSAGIDLISLDEYDVIHSNEIDGFSISGAAGAGLDAHTYTSTTKTLWSSYSSNTSKSYSSNTSNNKKTNTAKVRCCRACGRPDTICKSPVYY